MIELQNAASDLDLHCLQISILGVSRQQWVNYKCLGEMLLKSTNNMFLCKSGIVT